MLKLTGYIVFGRLSHRRRFLETKKLSICIFITYILDGGIIYIYIYMYMITRKINVKFVNFVNDYRAPIYALPTIGN